MCFQMTDIKADRTVFMSMLVAVFVVPLAAALVSWNDISVESFENTVTGFLGHVNSSICVIVDAESHGSLVRSYDTAQKNDGRH